MRKHNKKGRAPFFIMVLKAIKTARGQGLRDMGKKKGCKELTLHPIQQSNKSMKKKKLLYVLTFTTATKITI